MRVCACGVLLYCVCFVARLHVVCFVFVFAYWYVFVCVVCARVVVHVCFAHVSVCFAFACFVICVSRVWLLYVSPVFVVWVVCCACVIVCCVHLPAYVI